LRAATGPRAATDTLPLRGIVALGDLGFAVVRGTEPTGPGGRVTTAITLLDPKLQVLRGWQSTY
ncbi:MAG TPA: hypothetical protein VG712_00515, partial [Gemmatimonadales bacterium]|nr:hypothetical protein [Gemmatimonadales bacterium]